MIPECVPLDGAPFRVLPPGIHWADLGEVASRFACSDQRRWLFEGIQLAVTALQFAGCQRVYLNGSYVTEKDHPLDYDGCWDPTNVDPTRLDPVFLDFSNGRAAQKQKYRGEMFVLGKGNADDSFLGFFQTEKATGKGKGIVGLDLTANGALAT
jgi:hypothetical protein